MSDIDPCVVARLLPDDPTNTVQQSCKMLDQMKDMNKAAGEKWMADMDAKNAENARRVFRGSLVGDKIVLSAEATTTDYGRVKVSLSGDVPRPDDDSDQYLRRLWDKGRAGGVMVEAAVEFDRELDGSYETKVPTQYKVGISESEVAVGKEIKQAKDNDGNLMPEEASEIALKALSVQKERKSAAK